MDKPELVANESEEIDSALENVAIKELKFDIRFYGAISLIPLSSGITLLTFAILSLSETKKFISMIIPATLLLFLALFIINIVARAYLSYRFCIKDVFEESNITVEYWNESYSRILMPYGEHSTNTHFYRTLILNSKLPSGDLPNEKTPSIIRRRSSNHLINQLKNKTGLPPPRTSLFGGIF